MAAKSNKIDTCKAKKNAQKKTEKSSPENSLKNYPEVASELAPK